MKSRLVLLLTSAILVAGLALAAADSIDAAKRYQKTGWPGAARMPPMHGYWQSLSQGPSVIRFQPRKVYRALGASNRTHRICVQYRIYSFLYPISNEWELAWRRTSCVNVRPGYHANFGAVDFSNTVPDKAYNAEVWVTWHVGGRLQASGRWDYNSTRDYVCQTKACSVGYGFQNVAYIKFDYF